MPLSNAQTRDLNALLHPLTNLKVLAERGPLIIERGEGVRVFDTAGRDYIEGMSGLWCTALGWGDNELVEAAAEQMRKLSYGHVFGGKSHEPAAALAEKLKEISPFPVGKVFFGCSGSEANDTQVRFAWYAANARGQTRRKKIISRRMGYHGVTLAAASLTGIPSIHQGFDAPFDFALHADLPHHYRGAEPGESEMDYSARLAANLEALIEKEGADTIAAMIVEPVMGAGGAIVPPDGYFDAITKVLTRHAIPLISDEIITGFGRTGEWFGCAKYGFEPDSVSLAKGSVQRLSAGLRSVAVAGTDRSDRPRIQAYRRAGARSHLWRASGDDGGGAQGHRDLSAPRHCRTCAPCRAGLSGAVETTGKPSPGGRGKGRGPDRGSRTGGRQEDQGAFPGRPAGGAGRGEFRRRRRLDRASAAHRPHRALPAADHQRGRDRRDVRSSHPRAGRDRGLGDGRKLF